MGVCANACQACWIAAVTEAAIYAVTEEEEASLDTGTIKNKNCMCMDGCEQEVHLPSLSVYLSICVEQRGTVEPSSSSVQERGGLHACFSSQVRCD